MSAEKSKENKNRLWLIVIIAILVLLAGIQLFLSLYLGTYVEKQLTSAVTEQSHGQYELMMDEFSISLWGQKVQAEKVRLHPVDTASAVPTFETARISISGIRFLPYLFYGAIQVGEIRFLNPEISLVQNSPDSLSFLQSSGSDSNSNGRKPRTIEVDRFTIDNGAVMYLTSDQTDIRGELNDFNLDIAGIRIDSTSRVQAPYFEYSSIQTTSGKIRYHIDNGLYTFETNGIDFSTSGKYASVDSLKLIPRYPKYEFSQTVGHQLDRIDLQIKQLRLENPDIEKLKNGELKAEKFTIESANLEVFHDKHLPAGPETEKIFPHMAFKNVNFPVTVDTIAIHQSEISYAEHLPDVNEPGKVTFADVNATFTDVTNDSSAISQGHEIILDVTSEVMGEALLTAHFVLPMHQNGGHTVRGTLESMGADKLNPVLEPVGLIRVESGTIHSLQFLMDLGAEESTGWVQLVYSDLKFAVLDEENVNDGGKQRLKTFLASALKVKANNNDNPLRKGEVSVERLYTKSIFNYWWKSLSSGLKDNIGL